MAASPCDNRQHAPRPHLCQLYRWLQVRGDDGTLTTVAPENFPAEGVEVPDAETIALPEDAAQESTPDTDPADERRDDTHG